MDWSDQVTERCGAELAVQTAPRIYRGPTVDRDADLVERLRRREAGATEALVAAYGDRVYRLAIRITGNSLGCRGGRAGCPLGREPQDRHLPRDGRVRVLGLPDHRQRRLSEAAGTAGRAERDVVGRARARLRRDGRAGGAGARLVAATEGPRAPGRAAIRAPRRPSTSCRWSTARPFSCTTSKGSRMPRSRRRCRSSWPRSSRACIGLGSFCEAAWPPTWAGPSRESPPAIRRRRFARTRHFERAGSGPSPPPFGFLRIATPRAIRPAPIASNKYVDRQGRAQSSLYVHRPRALDPHPEPGRHSRARPPTSFRTSTFRSSPWPGSSPASTRKRWKAASPPASSGSSRRRWTTSSTSSRRR